MAQVNAGRVRFVSRGEYNNSTQYYLFDLVDYNGSSYFAKANTTGNVPTNTTYWQLVAEKGNTGGDGPVGPTGNGIASIVKTASAGLIDTYTITFTDGTTSTFNITNGQDGDVTQEYVDEENERLKTVFNVLPKTSGSGESIELENTGDTMLYKMDLKGNTSQEVVQGEVGTEVENTSIYVSDVNEDKENYITLKGNTYQDSTQGNQLIDFTNPTVVYSAVTYSFQNNILSASGTGVYISAIWNITSLYKANAGKTLKFSFKQLSNVTGSGAIAQINVSYNDGTVTQYLPMLYRNGKLTNRQIPNDVSNVQYVSFSIYPNNQSPAEAGSVTIEEPLLYFDNNNTYEPYTNGASPNPDYPQEVEVVTGLNEVIVEGKNLFNPISASLVQKGITSATGVISGDNNKRLENDNLILLQAGTYTISNAICDNVWVWTYNESQVYQYQELMTNWYSGNSYTFTLTANRYVRFLWRKSDDSVIDINSNFNIQLEKNSSSTSYEAYKGQTYEVNLGSIELCKIGTYQDRIYKNNGNWYLHKEIGKLSYSDNDYYSFTVNSVANDFVQFLTPAIDIIESLPSSVLCNYSVTGGSTASKKIRVNISHSVLGTTSSSTNSEARTAFINKMSGKTMVFYYPLQTPTDTQITDTTLVNQLNALYNATIYSTTHINTETSNLLPYINMKYNVVTPAPSPDRASEVEVVKGNNVIKIQNKNLLSLYNMQDTHTSNNMTASFSNGELNINGNSSASDGSTSGMNHSFTLTTPITLESGTYTINATLLSGSFTCASRSRIRKIALNGDGISMECSTGFGSTTFAKGTVTISETKTITSIQIIIYGACNFSNAKFGVQIEQGDTATSYVPYQSQSYNITLGNLELCKIGDYQDYFYKDSGKWYKYGAIGKVVLNGSESDWHTSGLSVTGYKSYYFGSSVPLTFVDSGKCNYFEFKSYNDWIGLLEATFIEIAYQSIGIRVVENLAPTLEDFKTWLSTHNTTVYYILATPTTTQITDQLLVSQLDELQKAMSYYDKTLITQTNADKPFILDVIGIRDLQDIFNL